MDILFPIIFDDPENSAVKTLFYERLAPRFNRWKFGLLLKYHRRDRELSIEDAIKKVGVSKREWVNWENFAVIPNPLQLINCSKWTEAHPSSFIFKTLVLPNKYRLRLIEGLRELHKFALDKGTNHEGNSFE